MNADIACIRVTDYVARHPYCAEFFDSFRERSSCEQSTIADWLDGLSEEVLLDQGFARQHVLDYLRSLNSRMEEQTQDMGLQSLTICGGQDKSGNPEPVELTMSPGEIFCIVGPTGAGKSRLLADIECLAQRDTPTRRQILVNGEVPDAELRFGMEHKLVAQISQNMNFVVDLSAEEFVTLHAQSRLGTEIGDVVERILRCANDLTGEKFAPSTSITQLSGGQSRALMIADTALLSASPIVLIDEIENAGVDRKRALELLVRKEKIVLISTHDPLLALMGKSRLVIRNGGIVQVIESSSQERVNLESLEKIDAQLMALRNRLRQGERLDEPLCFH